MKILHCPLGPLLLALTVVMPVFANGATYVSREVMSGLVTPRGLAFGPDGGLYVAEAGSGGTGPSVVLGNGATVFLGHTGALTRLLGGVQERVVTGLPSVATTTGLDAGGLQDIVFDKAGVAYGLIGFGSDAVQRNASLLPTGSVFGTIVRMPLGGGALQHVADIAAHESALNPAGGAIDCNPFGMTLTATGDFLVADAGANDLVKATSAGVVSTLAVFPARPNPLPVGPPVFQSVPTTVAIGPDGAFYVGQLTGFPFPPGAANVFRVDSNNGSIAVAYADFTNIIDMAFDADDNLFVLQVSSNGLASALGPGSGLLLRIDALTGERTIIASNELAFPGSLAIGPDGTLYVSNHTNLPTGGQVLSFTAVPEPSMPALLAGVLVCAVGQRGWSRFAASRKTHPRISISTSLFPLQGRS